MNTGAGIVAEQRTQRQGLIYAVAAYGIWGVAPIYFVWVGFAAPLEILMHRVLWSVPLLVLLITVTGQWDDARGSVSPGLAVLDGDGPAAEY